PFSRESGGWQELHNHYCLGRASLAQGKREEAARQFRAAVILDPALSTNVGPIVFGIAALGSLETAWDDPAAFHAFCRQYRKEHPEVIHSPFVQWFLEPNEPDSRFDDGDLQIANLTWTDPFHDGSYTGETQQAVSVQINAANGRDLWYINHSAPRLLRPVSGDFTAQTVCLPALNDRPAIGGLLLWQGGENYLRLERGTRGLEEISFQGCIGNKDVMIGRGRLQGVGRVLLRLERIGSRVN